jgi:endonuclease YncB( thermonuclease family)
MKIRTRNIIFIMLILMLSAGLLSVSSAYYKGTGFTHNIPDNYYDSYSQQEILNKYNDTYLTAEETAVCTKVVDGDTIYLSNGKKVRFVGVNTPEKGTAGYKASKNFVSKLCLNKEVSINVDDKKYTDKYGRTLAVVIVGGKNLNEMLLKEGLAEVMYIPPSEFSPYVWAGNSTSSASASTGTSSSNVATGSASTSEVVRSTSASDSVSSGSYIGNSNSFKFHTAGCSEVDRMSDKNKVYFSSKSDAINSGYVGCKKCNP